MNNMTICPTVCVEQILISITMLNLLFALFLLVLFFWLRKKISKKAYTLILVVLIILFLMSFNIDHVECGSGCSSGGIQFGGLDWFPSWIHQK